jgi:hypothetical protein
VGVRVNVFVTVCVAVVVNTIGLIVLVNIIGATVLVVVIVAGGFVRVSTGPCEANVAVIPIGVLVEKNIGQDNGVVVDFGVAE